jgi:hypothetical protein
MTEGAGGSDPPAERESLLWRPEAPRKSVSANRPIRRSAEPFVLSAGSLQTLSSRELEVRVDQALRAAASL